MSSDTNVQPEELRKPLGLGEGDGDETDPNGHYEGNGGPVGTTGETDGEEGHPEGNRPPSP